MSAVTACSPPSACPYDRLRHCESRGSRSSIASHPNPGPSRRPEGRRTAPACRPDCVAATTLALAGDPHRRAALEPFGAHAPILAPAVPGQVNARRFARRAATLAASTSIYPSIPEVLVPEFLNGWCNLAWVIADALLAHDAIPLALNFDPQSPLPSARIGTTPFRRLVAGGPDPIRWTR